MVLWTVTPDREATGRGAASPAPVADTRHTADDVAAGAVVQVASADPRAETSLRGASWDGAVRLDGDGRVIPDLGLRRRFDHALALTGELTLPLIREALAGSLAGEVEPRAVIDAMALFDRYIAYLTAVDGDADARAADPNRRLMALIRLRREHLGEAMAAGFFADEERLARHGIERRQITADVALDEGERRRRLEAVDASLPSALREARADALAAGDLAALDSEMQRRDADAASRHRERAARFGEAAAQRLALLDAQRADWDARVAAYVRERERLRLDMRQADATQQAAFAQLRARHFDEAGQRRIASLEAAGALPRSR